MSRSPTPARMTSTFNLSLNLNGGEGSSEVTIERITEYGDMYIEAIPESEDPPVRFLVGSQILYTASRVFLKMFGPSSPFAERMNLRGNPRHSTNPLADLPVIKLHDSPTVIGIVLKILHHVTDGIPRQLGFREFVEMAIVADKYELRRVLQLWADMWKKEFTSEQWTAPGNEDWLLIAWVFNYAEILHATSAQFIKRACYTPGGKLGSANGITVYPIDDHVPVSVIDKIRHERDTRVNKIRDTLRSAYASYNSSLVPASGVYKTCKRPFHKMECHALQLGDISMTMHKFDLHSDSFWNASLEEIARKLSGLQHIVYPGKHAEFSSKNGTSVVLKCENCDSAVVPAVTNQGVSRNYNFVRHSTDCPTLPHSECSWVPAVAAVVKKQLATVQGVDMMSFPSKQQKQK